MDTNNTTEFDPTSLGAKPVENAFDPTSIGARPYQDGQDVKDSSALLGATTAVNENHQQSLLGGIGGALEELGKLGTDVGVGIAKTGIDTAKGIGDMVGLKPTEFGQNLLRSSQDTSEGTPGKALGEFVGNTAQFIAPGGAEEAAFAKAVPFLERIKGLFGVGSKVGELATGVAKVGTRVAITGATAAGVTGLQTGGDTNAMKQNAVLGGAAGGLGQTLETFGKGLSTAIAKSDFKLTPAQEAKAATKAQSAAEFISNNKILGSESTKFQKLSDVNNQMESALQSSLPKNVGVSKQDVIDGINKGVETLKTSDPAIYEKARSQADSAINLLNSQTGTTKTNGGYINMQDTLNAKRSYGDLAFKSGKAVVKDPSVSSEGAYAVEQGYQQALEKRLGEVNGSINVKGMEGMFGGKSQVSLPEFNKVYSQAISAKDFTKLAQYKNDTGLVGKLFAIGAGRAVGHAIAPGLGPELIGATLGDVGANKLPSMIRNISQRAMSTGASTPITTAKIGMGVSRGQNSSNGEIQQ